MLKADKRFFKKQDNKWATYKIQIGTPQLQPVDAERVHQCLESQWKLISSENVALGDRLLSTTDLSQFLDYTNEPLKK